jgi:hypothetical protein
MVRFARTIGNFRPWLQTFAGLRDAACFGRA